MDGDQIPGYESLVDIGGGGFSRVYRANDVNNFRTVAVKVLNQTDVTDDQRKAFDRERKAMARVGTHPHVVQLLDSAFTKTGRPYIVMPFYENGTFADRVRDGTGLGTAEVLDVGVKIASALHTAHQHNIVHRDIKPSNIFQGDFGQHVLADFGISSFAEQESAHTKSVEVALSPSHAAPEVLDDERPTFLTDVYMLGSTLYTLLCGRLAFPGESLGAVIRKILTEPPAPLPDTHPPELRSLVMTMLSKAPHDRPESALAVAEALRQIQIDNGHTPTKISVRDWTPAETPTEITAEAPLVSEDTAASTSASTAASPAPAIAPAAAPERTGFDPDATTVRGTMATPQPAIDDDELSDDTSTPDSASSEGGRPVGVLAVGACAVILILSGLVWGATRSGDTEISDPTDDIVNPVDPDDALPILPTTPTNIDVSNGTADDELLVTWTGAGGPGITFDVRQQATPDAVENTAETRISLTVDTAFDLCVEVRTVSNSRLSDWSDPTCVGDDQPTNGN